jgi:C-terminal processing protease CtpA/Prc
MRRHPRVGTVILGLVLCGSAWSSAAQTLDSVQKAHAKEMLDSIKRKIQSTYYDPTFHGIDLNAKFKEAEKKIDTGTSVSYAYAVIAQTLLDFGDSHLYFIPPQRANKFEYGWTFGMVGDKCFVQGVKPGSDAESKGLKVGDEILKIETMTPSRQELWKIKYLYYALSPRQTLHLQVQSPRQSPRDLAIAAQVTKKPEVQEISIEGLDQMLDTEERESFRDAVRVSRVGDVAVWKLESFEIDGGSAERVIDTATKGASALVIDLRGNGGGFVKTMQQIVSRLVDHDVTIAPVKERQNAKALVAKPKKPVFAGKLIVLIDADSASASEVLARTLQLEDRAQVMGDTSAGAVMQAIGHQDGLEGTEGVIVYGASITNADLVMKDGKSLEHVGVTPGEVLLPTGEDLAAGRDPLLAKAISLAGGTITPEEAGKMFPIRWKKPDR